MAEAKQERYELTITADGIVSTDERFTMENLWLGDHYKPVGAYFRNAEGALVYRDYIKHERRNTNQTLPRLACQVFEQQLAALSADEKTDMPICQYTPSAEIIRGIFPSVEAFRRYKNSIEFLRYHYDDGKQFIMYCWNIFSPLLFVQECLKRFGRAGERFVLVYREKDKAEAEQTENKEFAMEEWFQEFSGCGNAYSVMLLEAKNIIFRGAPGTGKSYLAKELAADIVSRGAVKKWSSLSDEQKEQVEFVQFHPSYDYTDFVEGLRPVMNANGSMGFERQDGVFKRFAEKAKTNFENAQRSPEASAKASSVQEQMKAYFSDVMDAEKPGANELKIVRGTQFTIMAVDDKWIDIYLQGDLAANKLRLKTGELQRMLESSQDFMQAKDVTAFFQRSNGTQEDSYYLSIYKAVKAKKMPENTAAPKREELKPYIFIIDEINRGEISKIFGELFFSIDPGYRGPDGAVSTQYANVHGESEKKFYIPENIFVIGTMNDIDRSVDSFDFAMRRRFRFIEVKSNERLEMLDVLGGLKGKAVEKMTALNNEISKVDELNENYHIGAAYFLKMQDLSSDERTAFGQLWGDYLRPLLQEYVRGMYDEKDIMQRFEKAYNGDGTEAGGGDDAS